MKDGEVRAAPLANDERPPRTPEQRIREAGTNGHLDLRAESQECELVLGEGPTQAAKLPLKVADVLDARGHPPDANVRDKGGGCPFRV